MKKKKKQTFLHWLGERYFYYRKKMWMNLVDWGQIDSNTKVYTEKQILKKYIKYKKG